MGKKPTNLKSETKHNTENINRFNSMISMFEGENEEKESTIVPTNNSTVNTEQTTNIDYSKYKDKKRLVEEQQQTEQDNESKVDNQSSKKKKLKRLPPPPPDHEEQPSGGAASAAATEEIKKLKDELERLREEFESREAEIKLQEKEFRKKLKDIKEQKKEVQSILESSAPKIFAKHASKSIAIPANILDDITSEEMATYLVEMISRMVVLFAVDEIIVYQSALSNSTSDKLMKLLEYIETPRNIRYHLFDLDDPDYKFVDKLKKMEAAHHNTTNRWTRYREGVVTDKVEAGTSLIDVGLGHGKEALADKKLQPGIRVTLEMEEDSKSREQNNSNSKYKKGKLVSPRQVKEAGHYWGYTIRHVKSLDSLDAESPYGSYDCRVLISQDASAASLESTNFENTAQMKNIVLVFAENKDTRMADTNYTVNTLGSEILSRRPRFEETLTISLTNLTNKLYSSVVEVHHLYDVTFLVNKIKDQVLNVISTSNNIIQLTYIYIINNISFLAATPFLEFRCPNSNIEISIARQTTTFST
ncbi:DUF171 family protein [Heterostelium album PN500]|uniref:DUF171 family protein n=1 Tax=Heterostelium pallidum (strain ATCC 26659 / Pp 5 / PN500) TaxID=670386 RepID=D3BEM0_HETP5|nr:DUF171 family protein [Heterostelium album PN500]EFA80351.1 DUF171 family protein [Heterostelium album PN500]|eukprot:XP_020432471.1 DUF171 family protein [Heterostelium album PN500]